MTSIDRAAALAALIRAQLNNQREARPPVAVGHLRESVATGKEPPVQTQAYTAGASGSNIEQHSRILQQVKKLLPDDPRNKRKAFRIFLEAVLGQEFGRELIGGSLDQLVGQVLVQMEDDAELLQAMDEAGKQLLLEAGVLKVG